MNTNSLEDLKVWQESRGFRKIISKLVKSFPGEEKYRLLDQMIRSSRSVTANIAEGHGRYHYQENTQFCRQARGSLVETYDHLTCALDEGYISEKQFQEVENDYTPLLKMLNGYIRYLQKMKHEK